MIETTDHVLAASTWMPAIFKHDQNILIMEKSWLHPDARCFYKMVNRFWPLRFWGSIWIPRHGVWMIVRFPYVVLCGLSQDASRDAKQFLDARWWRPNASPLTTSHRSIQCRGFLRKFYAMAKLVKEAYEYSLFGRY